MRTAIAVRKAYKFRLYPNKQQEAKLLWTLDLCRELYNAALQERRDAYEMHVKRHPGYYDEETRKQLTRELTTGYYEQKRDLPEIKELRPEYNDIYSQVLQDVLLRLKRAFDGFFKRVKRGEKPEYRLILSKIGTLKLKLHREIEGTIKTCTIKYEVGQWYVIFSCEVKQPEPLPVSYEDIGIDLGITHFAALSNGEFIESPRLYRRTEKHLKKLQQALSRKKRGSHRRKQAVRAVARAHRKVHNQRRDFLHKAARKLVNRYQVVVLEDLQTSNLVKRPKPKQDEETGQYLPNGATAKGGLNKSITDASWSMFTELLRVKAAWAGRTVILVDPKYTSQICPGCGAIHKKTLEERWHSCECGCELDRDTAAAQIILDIGYQQLRAGSAPQINLHGESVKVLPL